MATRSVNNAPVNGNANALNPAKAGVVPADVAKANAVAAPTGIIPSAAKPNKAAKPDAKAGSVQISDDAKQRAEAFQKAHDIAMKTPDVREDRVAALKKQIDAGTYQVDSGKIADGMMREAIREHLAESEA